jgi:cytosine/uracil/thiamine/allantoin permease
MMPWRQMTRKQSIHHVLEGETLEGINGVYIVDYWKTTLMISIIMK